MENSVEQFFEEAINLERNIRATYMVFQKNSPADQAFWARLAEEEKRHAALLMSCRDISSELWQFPKEMFPKSVQDLVDANARLMSLVEDFNQSPPDRQTAFKTALNLETSAGEIHYQLAMSQPPQSKLLMIFKELNGGDLDHHKRIKKYMRENGMIGESR